MEKGVSITKYIEVYIKIPLLSIGMFPSLFLISILKTSQYVLELYNKKEKYSLK